MEALVFTDRPVDLGHGGIDRLALGRHVAGEAMKTTICMDEVGMVHQASRTNVSTRRLLLPALLPPLVSGM